jgi:cell division protein FtsZ
VMPVEAAPVMHQVGSVPTGRPNVVDRFAATMPLTPAAMPLEYMQAAAMQHAAPARGTAGSAPAPASPPRSLFGIVTGAIRRNVAALPPAEPPRAEPVFEAPQPTVRPSAAEEVGLEIPAFLRRQS